jgi:hypothetical protein
VETGRGIVTTAIELDCRNGVCRDVLKNECAFSRNFNHVGATLFMESPMTLRNDPDVSPTSFEKYGQMATPQHPEDATWTRKRLRGRRQKRVTQFG